MWEERSGNEEDRYLRLKSKFPSKGRDYELIKRQPTGTEEERQREKEPGSTVKNKKYRLEYRKTGVLKRV